MKLICCMASLITRRIPILSFTSRKTSFIFPKFEPCKACVTTLSLPRASNEFHAFLFHCLFPLSPFQAMLRYLVFMFSGSGLPTEVNFGFLCQKCKASLCSIFQFTKGNRVFAICGTTLIVALGRCYPPPVKLIFVYELLKQESLSVTQKWFDHLSCLLL